MLRMVGLCGPLKRRLSDERGIALVMALSMLTVLSILSTTLLFYSSTASRQSAISERQGAAYYLAEAGVNNAMAILSNPTQNALDKYALCPDSATNPPLPCQHTDTFDTGQVAWQGTLNTNPALGTAWWTITSTGYTRNPSASDGSRLPRTITANIAIIPTMSQPLNNPSWNYIFARAPTWSGTALSGCDMTVANSVNITANLYVLGNLCFQNRAKMSSGKLYVKGSFDQQQSANQVGAPSTDISEAHIGMGCRYQNQSLHNPCVYGAGGGSGTRDNIWAALINATVTPISPPTVDWNGWYLNASPGPYYPCDPTMAGGGTAPTFSFDNPVAAMADSDAHKLTFKNDNQGVINLTPSTSYTCRTLSGELSWDASNRVLTVAGTIFIDGSAKIDNGATNIYKGSATLYLNGTFLMKGGGGSTKLCPNSSWTGSACDTTRWDSQKDLLGIIVNGNGSLAADNQVPSGDGAQFVSSYFMGAVYATNVIDIDTTALVDGPLDGSTVNLGQSSTSTFNGFTFVPVGLPGENTVYAQPQMPTFGGG
jgi:Tfp pilus assembly protein PilX